MRTPRSQLASRSWLRLPRPTARLRLTALFGTLFVVAAAALLGLTYLLVAGAAEPGILMGTVTRHGILAPGTQRQATGAAFDMNELLAASGIALGIVGAAAFLLGWLAAGRILRPLATITATARRISASNLRERLSLPGPDDEIKDLGDTLDALFDRLEVSFEAQRHFVANASHELRTPLAADRTVLQVALEDSAAPDIWRAAFEELLASNTEQERLIEALLTLASSEGGLEQREPIDLAAVTDEVLLAPRPEIGRLGLHVAATTNPAPVHGDPVLAKRLVTNLIDNAIQHNIPGGQVRVSTGISGGHPVLSVSSTGPAIPPGQVARLFQPFQRLHSRRGSNGHGLGLSIVRAIATAHGANVTAVAPPSGGLDVTVTFPSPASNRAASVSQSRVRSARSRRVSSRHAKPGA
jgi:signal transduction histidine kinase